MATKIMASSPILLQLMAWSLALLGASVVSAVASEERRSYIIHMDHSHKPESFPTQESWYRSILAALLPADDSTVHERFLYSYSNVINGFSARLTLSELSELEKAPAHVATYPDSVVKLFTTHTPRFLGLTHRAGLGPAASYGRGMIIGMIDTGVWPESASFDDRGMPPVPERWKGVCENGTAFSPSMCNRKLIGARSFSKGLKAIGINISTEYDYDSPRDFLGHGTHTASTAAGSLVRGAAYFGYAEGSARGIATSAHVAMYKVLWATDDPSRSMASDVLAGMDQAIADGVDVMSLSLGLVTQVPYYQDVIAIAAFSAIERGIIVVCAAGNDGAPVSTHNGAPWITTVGAGTIDRSFVARLTLGNGVTVEGTSYFPESIYIADAPLYYGKDNASKSACTPAALDPAEVGESVVICDISNKTDIFLQLLEVYRAGAKAGIFFNDAMFMDPEDYYIPSVVLDSSAADTVRAYATSTSNTTVQEMTFEITELGSKPAPKVAYFSSRGPDPITPGILKPDILAPGKDVLASWVPKNPYAQIGDDYLTTEYALASGTSMAAPHVAGVTAMVKAVHPEWSPAAVRSAMMTTATTLDNTLEAIRDESTKLPATPLDFGAGHINPNKAIDPGLIYDINMQAYIDFLCGLGYTKAQMSAVLRRTQWGCGKNNSELNYPSFIAMFPNTTTFPAMKSFTRVVTNVGSNAAVYRPAFQVPKGVKIATVPNVLEFTSKFQKIEFVLNLELDAEAWGEGSMIYGLFKWVDEQNHTVSSPVVAISS